MTTRPSRQRSLSLDDGWGTGATTAGDARLGVRLQKFREQQGLSQGELARRMGVGQTAIHRWENGTGKIPLSSVDYLTAHGFGEVPESETKVHQRPRLLQNRYSDLRGAIRRRLRIGGEMLAFEPSPYVVNGPPEQLPFFELLYQLQEGDSAIGPVNSNARRLSGIAKIGDPPTVPAQVILEAPKSTALHWNTNYGSHGWHRYVGRFPPHLVRALLNHFALRPGDTVCDPFAGSGTTLVESRLLGIDAIGIEICSLSALMCRVKSTFPSGADTLDPLVMALRDFYEARWTQITAQFTNGSFTHADILPYVDRYIPRFANDQKWLTPEALLGCGIVVEFAGSLRGFRQDAVALALSARMRSIGNVDVDVVRAEYSRKKRQNVDVLGLVTRTLERYASDIREMASSHYGLIGTSEQIRVLETSALDARVPPGSIDCIITSPPYGVESLSYLRTHLLSYRVLARILKTDPYDVDSRIIGNEYLPKAQDGEAGEEASGRSQTFREFFGSDHKVGCEGVTPMRRMMMAKFFDQMVDVSERFASWMPRGGRMAFVIGNKRLGNRMIPTHAIVGDLFQSAGFRPIGTFQHKLKCNNTNSEVPWQERTIQQEFILLFQRR